MELVASVASLQHERLLFTGKPWRAQAGRIYDRRRADRRERFTRDVDGGASIGGLAVGGADEIK